MREALPRRLETLTTDPDEPLHQHAYRTPLRDERVVLARSEGQTSSAMRGASRLKTQTANAQTAA